MLNLESVKPNAQYSAGALGKVIGKSGNTIKRWAKAGRLKFHLRRDGQNEMFFIGSEVLMNLRAEL